MPNILSFFSSGPVIRYCSGTSPAQNPHRGSHLYRGYYFSGINFHQHL
ncbi:MAG: hypothetical protein ABIP70_07710 [Ferruginibacter sp.]